MAITRLKIWGGGHLSFLPEASYGPANRYIVMKKIAFNPIQTGLFWPSLDLGGEEGGRQTPPPPPIPSVS